MAKKKLCPQCKVGRFRVKNIDGDSVVVTVSEQLVVEALHPEQSLEGFDLTVLYCLGCSWKGSVNALVNH